MTEKMFDEAQRIWEALSVDTREKILEAVWCPRCVTAATIRDYTLTLDRGDVILKGSCSICGHEVARVLEGQKVKIQKQKVPLKYFVFDIQLLGNGRLTEDKKVIRKIQIAGTKSLYNFARVITQAFGFYFDHCFGFYDTLRDRENCKKVFELFVDIGEEKETKVKKGVKKIKISQAFKNIGEKMIFLFDYGDGWEFNVELKEIRNAEKHDLKPVILESIGKAPMQYPPCEDDLPDNVLMFKSAGR